MEKRETWLSELVEDLTQRKVDTIVARDGITGRAMPDPATALLDIHNTYFRRLVTLGLVEGASKPGAGVFDKAGWLLPNDAARKWLLSTALLGMSKTGLKPADACVLQRIASTCSALSPIVAKIEQQLPSEVISSDTEEPESLRGSSAEAKSASRRYYVDEKRKMPDVELTRQESAALSKAWELGADTVALQTVAMLDGDIITRISEQYTGDAYAVVRQLHHEAVDMSLTTWDRLAKGVAAFFDGLLGRKD